MWSGAPQWANWALQPQQYQDMNNDEVDWAALAKQWIQMKETVDVPPVPPSSLQAPTSSPSFSDQTPAKPPVKNEGPPSFISHHQPPPPPPPGPPPSQFLAKAEDEGELQLGGEMDMEIEDDKDNVSNGELAHTALPAPNNSGEPWQEWWNGTSAPAEGAAGWGWGWGPVDASHPVVPDLEPPGTSEPIPHTHYSSKSHQIGNYNWGHDMLPETDQIAMRGVTDYGHRSRRNKPPFTVDPSLEIEKEADFHLDAAQRKKLPLWIREGLEKMEREKQRKFEREQEVKHKEEMLRRKKEAEKQARKILKDGFVADGVENIIPSKSKFDSDSDESNHSDQEPDEKTPAVVVKKNSRFDVAPPPSVEIKQRLNIFKDEPEEEGKMRFSKLTEEEKLQQMMIKLKRWMTEILLDVTTSMIHETASEVISKARSKAPQVQVKKSSALTTLSRGLGLSIYSDSEDETSDDGGKRNGGPHQGEESDSEDDLRDIIVRKKKEFEVTEKSILQKLQKYEDENRARELSVETTRSSSISRSSPNHSEKDRNASSRSPSNEKSGDDEKPDNVSIDKQNGSEDSDDSDSQSESESKSDESTLDDKDASHDSSVDRKESSEEELIKKRTKRQTYSEERKLKRSSSRDSNGRQATSIERISDRSVSRDRKSRRSSSKERKHKRSVAKEKKSNRSISRERMARIPSQERKARRSSSRDRKNRRSVSMDRSRRSISRGRTHIRPRYKEDSYRRPFGRTSRSPHRRAKRSGSRSRRQYSRNHSVSQGARPRSSSRERSKRTFRISSRDKRFTNHSRSRSKSRDRRSRRSLSKKKPLKRSVSIASRSPRSISHDRKFKRSVSIDKRSKYISSRRRSSRNESPTITGRHSSRSSSRPRRRRKRARKRSSSSSSSSVRKAKPRRRRSSSSSDNSSEVNRVEKKKRKKRRRHSSQGSSS